MKLKQIIEHVGRQHGFEASELTSRERNARLNYARQLAMTLAHKRGFTNAKIARAFGRCEGTVYQAKRTIYGRASVEKSVREDLIAVGVPYAIKAVSEGWITGRQAA